VDLLTESQLTVEHVQNNNLNNLGWSLIGLWLFVGCLGTFIQFCGLKYLFKCCPKKSASGSQVPNQQPSTSPFPSLGKSFPFSTFKSSRSPVLSSLISQDGFVQGKAGLNNLGNTCFMNATLQSLFAVSSFRNKLLSRKPPTTSYAIETTMLDDMTSIVHQMHQASVSSSSSSSVSPTESRQVLAKLEFNNGKQHDASEFLRKLFNMMLEEVPPGEVNLIKSIFGFETVGVVRCDECQQQSVTKESSLDLSLEIPSHLTSSESTGSIISFDQLISNYFKATPLVGDALYQCDSCQKLTTAKRTTHITFFPSSLVITLNRFRYDPMTGNKIKIMHNILISETLTISTEKFILDSLIVHTGSSVDGGHYYAFSRLPVELSANDTAATDKKKKKEWYMFDDRCVTKTSFPAILESFENSLASAYVLFYTKK
jgi:ubiquitin carboxyl-terminal hydrolase 17